DRCSFLPHLLLFVSLCRVPPTSPLFPYTTLFRSNLRFEAAADRQQLLLVHRVLAAMFEMVFVHRGQHDGIHRAGFFAKAAVNARSEEHTSELQSREKLVCRLLLEKKKHDNWIEAR